MTTTAAKWQQRVAEWRASGLTSTEYAAGEDFTAGGLRHWAYRLGKAARPGARREPRASGRAARPVPMARVRRVPAASVLGAAAPQEVDSADQGRGADSGGELRIEVRDESLLILVPRGCDGDTLSTVLGVVRQVGRGAAR